MTTAAKHNPESNMGKKHSPRFLKVVEAAKQNVRECTVHDVKQKLDAGEQMHLVDVREDNEWDKGHLPRAKHIGKGVIERDIETLIPDVRAPIFLYCGGGYRSALAAEVLGRMGYENVISVDGGFRGWQEAGYPIEKEG
jgi:rhodanese-related sulfurtransferase